MLKIDLDVEEYFLFLEELKSAIELEASNLASYSGNSDDGGAVALRNEITSYFMALNKEIPLKWKKYLDDFKLKQRAKKDKKFAEYLELKKIYEGDNGI